MKLFYKTPVNTSLLIVFTHTTRKTNFNFSSFLEISLFFHHQIHIFYKKNFSKKVSLKNRKIIGECGENLQPQIPELQFLKTLFLPRSP